MGRAANAIAEMIEKALERLITQRGIPAGAVINQLPSTTIPPANATDRGGVLLSDTTPNAVGTAAAGTGTAVSRYDHIHAHGNQAGGTLHSAATSSTAGFATLSDATPQPTGTAAAGTGVTVSRNDHVHALSDHDHTGTAGGGGKLTNEAHDGYSIYEEIAAPSSPAANTARLYAKDNGSGVTELYYKNDAGTERDLSAAGGSGAPTGATYITQTHDATLSAEQALGDLATGILKNTTTTGVLSIATSGTDYAAADHDHTGSGDGGKLTNDDHDGYSVYEEIAAPSSPAANTLRLYAKDKSGVTELFYKNDSGTERDLSSAGGSGAPTTVPYVTTASDGTLSAEVVIPGLAGSGDIAGIGGGGITEEYDTTTTGLSWGSAPATEDSNTTVLSHLYLKLTGTNSEDLGTRSWTPGSGAFDARTKLAMGSEAVSNFQSFGLHIGASSNTSRLLCDILMDFTNLRWSIRGFTYASGSYTQRGSSWLLYGLPEIYVRITRDGSNNVAFSFSPNGRTWQRIATVSFTLTVANIGYRISADNASTNYEYISDWLRTNA